MKNIFKYLMLAFAVVCGFSLTSCKDDDVTLSRKVLTSVSVMEYDGEEPDSQIILVTSDGDWVVEAPEWIKVSPAAGSAGQTEVEITVDENFRDGAIDIPRRANVLFKGRNLESIATVLVKQSGDKFRDIASYSVSDLADVKDGTVVCISNMVVMDITASGCMATDGSNIVFIKDIVSPVSVGDKIMISGEKHLDNMKMLYVLGEKIESNGTGSVPTLTPKDISENVDLTSGNNYDYVTFSGGYNGEYMTVGKNVSMVYLNEAHASLGLKDLAGHRLTVTGYFAGNAYPAVNIIPVKVEDLGIDEVILFKDDFEWLEPWALAGKDGKTPAADSVGGDNPGGEAPQITACKIDVDGVTVNAGQAMEAKGYGFLRVTPTSDNAGECIYLQRNYLKMGKTAFQAGLILPKLENVDDKPVEAKMTFNWAPQSTNKKAAKDRKWDVVNLIIVVENNGVETTYGVAPHDFVNGESVFHWMNATVNLKGITKDSKITIKQNEWKVESANRWYIDNIKIVAKQ